MTKQEKIDSFNISGVGIDNGRIFGMPFNFEESEILILPVPWELTCSFGNGTSLAPERMLDASRQLDFYHTDFPDAWKQGIFMLQASKEISQLNRSLKAKAGQAILLQEKGKSVEELSTEISQINEACERMNNWVLEQSRTLLNRDKKVILLGGDHSTPLGLLQALSQKYDTFGVLQIDAHSDLRDSYEGFEFSHASIFHNTLKLNSISNLTQVGVRDVCAEEMELINKDERIAFYADSAIKKQLFDGKTWKQQVEEIVGQLPQNVYLSFDIDGLDPSLCPNTGTPVPGGLGFWEAIALIAEVKKSGRNIIGADLCEVGDSDWDANVGARILYQLCCYI